MNMKKFSKICLLMLLLALAVFTVQPVLIFAMLAAGGPAPAAAPEEARPRDTLTLEKVRSLAGPKLSYADFSTNFGYFDNYSPNGDGGIIFEIDESWQLHYRANAAWEFLGFFLQHLPSGEEVNVETGDVEGFIREHE